MFHLKVFLLRLNRNDLSKIPFKDAAQLISVDKYYVMMINRRCIFSLALALGLEETSSTVCIGWCWVLLLSFIRKL